MTHKFYYQNGLIIVPATVSGDKKTDFPVMLALDTGSFHTNIKPEVLDKVGAQLTNRKAVLLGVGEKVHTTYSVLKLLNVFNIALNEAVVTSHPLPDDYPIDGLLGNDFFQQHKICIDYANSILSIQ